MSFLKEYKIFNIAKKKYKNFCETPPQNGLLMSIYDREIIYLPWTRKNKNGEKNKKKEAENEVGYKLKMVFSRVFFNVYRREKLWKQTRSKNTTIEAKCSTLYFAPQNSVLCEAVNSLIKQSAEEILHTLLNENKNKFQEENHHFIFSVSYGEIP